jgi:hypothetical protein
MTQSTFSASGDSILTIVALTVQELYDDRETRTTSPKFQLLVHPRTFHSG